MALVGSTHSQGEAGPLAAQPGTFTTVKRRQTDRQTEKRTAWAEDDQSGRLADDCTLPLTLAR